MRPVAQHSADAVWIIELNKAKTTGLVCDLVLHNHTVDHLAILSKVVLETLCNQEKQAENILKQNRKSTS